MKLLKRLALIASTIIFAFSGVAQNENSLHFDGLNDKIDLPAGTHSGITTNGTLEAWIKTSANNSGYRGIVVRSNYYGLFLIDNKLSTFVWGGGAPGATTYNNVSLNDGIWHHVALRIQIGVTNGTQMYLDGQPVGPAISLYITTANNNFQLGCNTNVQFFNGQIDNVKIYNRALSASEINDSYSCLPVNSAGLNGSYNFNQGVAASNNVGTTTLSDQSGNNNNGTMSNFALNGSTSNWVNGKLCCFLSSNISGTTTYCLAETINLTASFTAISSETITGYQWKKNGVNVSDGGNISGATSANLQIANVVSSDFGTYSVVVSSTCGSDSAEVDIINSANINLSNLVAHYTFDNNSAVDVSGNNYNATGSNITSTVNRFNQANSAFSFNGTSSSVTIASPTGQTILGNGQNKSISLWFKRGSTSSKGMLLGYQEATPGNWNPLAYIGNDGVLRGWMYQGGFAAWTSGTTIDTNWHHLALVYTTNLQTVYLDGSEVATMNGTLQPGASNYIVIGNGYANTGIAGISTTGNQPFLGVIDEVRFYNTALSLANVNTIVTTPFIITNQPEETCAQIGNQASLSIDVLGSVTYQWQKDGVDIPGATSSIYTISNVQLSDFGLYRCIITSQCDNSLSSISAEVSLGTGDVNITQQPQNTSACSGSSASFSIVLTGPTVFFQWKKNGVDISGATNSILNLTNVNSSDAGNYTVDILGGSCGTVSSEVATLTVTAVNSDVTQTGNTLTAVQSGANYTWVDCNNGNQPIAGANGQSFTPTTIGSYAVEIELNGCSALSTCVQINSVGLEDDKEFVFGVQPNPASDILNITVSYPTSAVIAASNGTIVKTLALEGMNTIDINLFAKGVYYIRTAEGHTEKFIKE
jgi:hypothetical protein